MRGHVLALTLLMLCSVGLHAQSATVTWGTTHQTMDGFGGQTWMSANALTNAQADLFFSPTAGIGLEYVRTANTADGSIPDLTTLREAVARGALVELSLQSPPATLKTSGVFTDGTAGGNGGCLPNANFAAYATYIVNTINTFQSSGVPISVLSVQNEPNITMSSLGACIWTAALFDTFVKNNLGPTLAGAGLTPQVMLGESASWFSPDLVTTCLTDGACAAYVSIAAAHGYGGDGPPDGFPGQAPGSYCCATASLYSTTKKVWQSEVNGGFTYQSGPGLWTWDPSMADAIIWARNIHDYLTVANASAWEYWELADCCGGPFNDGLTDGSFNTSKRMYVVGQWSKFVRTGMVRVDTTTNPQAGVFVTAFKNPTTNDFVIVAVNQNGSNTSQTFNLSGFPGLPTTAIPTLTDLTHNLSPQTNATISGTSMTYTLLANSVTTFTATAAGGGGGGGSTNYISQAGGVFSGGSFCNGQTAISAAAFNALSSLPVGSTNYLCGTFTGSAGGTMIFLPASGSAGNVDQLIFDTNATFTAPYWLNGGNAMGGAINTNGKNYWTISGGPNCGWTAATLSDVACNGTIVNTANGTNLTYKNTTTAMQLVNSDHIEVKNLDMHNMYIKVGTGLDPSTNNTDLNGINCIFLAGNTTNITIDHNVCHDVGWAYEGGTDNYTFGPGNETYNMCHGIQTGPIHGTIQGNHFHDWGKFAVDGQICHGDGVHCYSDVTGHTLNLDIYNNQFDGDSGVSMQEFIFLEGDVSPTRCMAPGGTFHVFNNVGIDNSGMHQAMWGLYGNANTGDTGDVVVNNTAVSAFPNDNVADTAFADNFNVNYQNNVNGGHGLLIQWANPNVSFTTADYNAYENCASFGCFSAAGVSSGACEAWKAAGLDPHGICQAYPMNTVNFLGLNAACAPTAVAVTCAPATGSPLLNAGNNLSSLCTGALVPLCSDIANNPRPAVGLWTIGAYQVQGVGGSPVVSLSATTVTYVTPAGTPNSQTVTLTNTGTLALTMTSVVISGGGGLYTLTGDTCSGNVIAIQATCTFTPRFAPILGGLTSATITLTDNANPTTQTVTLNGNSTNTPPGPPPVNSLFAATGGVGTTTSSCSLSIAGQAQLCLVGTGLWLSINGSQWSKVLMGSFPVTSVNGKTGAVTLKATTTSTTAVQ